MVLDASLLLSFFRSLPQPRSSVSFSKPLGGFESWSYVVNVGPVQSIRNEFDALPSVQFQRNRLGCIHFHALVAGAAVSLLVRSPIARGWPSPWSPSQV